MSSDNNYRCNIPPDSFVVDSVQHICDAITIYVPHIGNVIFTLTKPFNPLIDVLMLIIINIINM